MRRWMAALAAGMLVVLGVAACGGGDTAASAGSKSLILATTTSTQDSGLLDVLVPAFERETGDTVKTIAVGSGQALELGRRGEADVVLSHSPAAEQDLMATGVAGQRRIVMHNDFVIVGPAGDPARIKGRTPTAALKAIAASRSPFIARGDDSGTSKLELGLWDAAGITPAGGWYQESGQGMGATLRIADEKRAYTISDRGTYLTQPGGLKVLVQGDPSLLNVYHVIDITQKAGSRVNVTGGKAFADWIVSPRAQAMIGGFGRAKYGRALFTPDAGKSDAEVKAAA